MFFAKTLLLSASLAGIVSSSVLPRQDVDEAPSPSPTATSVPEEVAKAADPVETEIIPKPVHHPDCSVWYDVRGGDSCTSISIEQHLSLDDLDDFNAAGVVDFEMMCARLYPRDRLCLGIPGREPDPSRPQPIHRGTTRDCEAYHLREDGESCLTLREEYHLPAAELNAWNPGVCNRLRTGWYLCVGADGFEPDLSTPQPSLPNTRNGCDEYHKIVRGDNCYNLSVEYGVELEDFFGWNPDLDVACSNLQEDYYVCVSE